MSESIFGGMMVPSRSIVGGFEILCKRCHKKLTICTGNSVQAEEQARLHGWREMCDGWICWEHEDEKMAK